MKLYVKKSATLVSLCLGALLAFTIFLVLIMSNNGPAQAEVNGGRLITVHDRGEAISFITAKTTLKEALEEQAIEVYEKDAIEPSLDEKLVAPNYQVNIYRARPVVVVDGAFRQKVVTPYQSAERIAKDAGVVLYREDEIALTRSADIVGDGAGLQLTIDRATVVNVNLYGKKTELRTQAETVAEMLKEKDITLGTNGRASLDLGTKLYDGIELTVWREGKQTVTIDEDVNFETEQIKDVDRPIGYKAVQREGVMGKRTVTYEVEIRDGNEVSRTEIASLSTLEPVNQVVVVGSKVPFTTPSDNEAISWNFFLSQGFTIEQTAGIMGNLMQEHKFNTTDVPGGMGIAQWLGARRANLLARENPYSIYTQLEFIMHEFATTEHRAYRAVKSAATVEQAVAAFQNSYERCGYCREDLRIQYAYSILNRYR